MLVARSFELVDEPLKVRLSNLAERSVKRSGDFHLAAFRIP
jgi:hypothetical protein